VQRLYSDLASWYPLVSPPSHYGEEAADLLPTILAAASPAPATLLELGCGSGSLAFHLKRHLTLTLTDLSEEMLALSRAVNPECEHLQGDMTTLDLGRTFDVVLIHDAIMYMTTPGMLKAAMATAVRHCREGGGVLFMPDCVTETFEPKTEQGGEDAPDGRALRYLQWDWDPDPTDHTIDVAYAFMLRERDGSMRVELDRHREGLFRRASWLQWMSEAGLRDARSRIDPWERDVFSGRRV
jgi:ubiquinone/menaquinone biosynthesis C-methylase UbiE